jgi:hypothetical protein
MTPLPLAALRSLHRANLSAGHQDQRTLENNRFRWDDAVVPVMVREGAPTTSCAEISTARHGWRAFAHHDDQWAERCTRRDDNS